MTKKLHVLLADDDSDDRFFFGKAVNIASVPAYLTSVPNGEALMKLLNENTGPLADLLFLDLNMPRKNGTECLNEIKANPKLQSLPVVIYSTSLHEEIADLLFAAGAHYYIKKASIAEMQFVLNHILNLVTVNNFSRPNRNEFILKGIPA